MRGAVLILIAAALAGCNADVVLGRNFPADAALADAGDDGGTGQLDGGTTDGGALDGGADAGGSDAGTDGGVDAGLDAGLDAGQDGGADAGVDAGVDAGTDAGVDAGPANLRLDLTGPLVVQAADPGTFTATLTNSGGVASAPQLVVITFPPGLTFVSATGGCASSAATEVSCDLGMVPALSSVSGSATVTVFAPDSGLGWHQVSAAAGPLDASTPLSATGVGALVLQVVAPRLLKVDACFGSNLYSYSQCTPASLVSATVMLLADGGIDSLDAGYYGQWGQSPHLRNLGFRFMAPPNINGTRFSGASVSATCFEGVVDNPMGTHNVGAFQGCLQ